MVAGAPAQRVRDVVEPATSAVGLLLEEVEVVKAGARSVVRVVVDLPEDADGELDLDRIGDATRAVSDALDADDVLPGHYTLEVTSPGVSRPLTQRRHFVRAVGRSVTLHLSDGGTLAGRLTDVERGDGDAAWLMVTPVTPGAKGRPDKVGQPVRVDVRDVREGRVEVDLSGLRSADDDEAAAADGGEG